jgi:hypothetical protein
VHLHESLNFFSCDQSAVSILSLHLWCATTVSYTIISGKLSGFTEKIFKVLTEPPITSCCSMLLSYLSKATHPPIHQHVILRTVGNKAAHEGMGLSLYLLLDIDEDTSRYRVTHRF